MAKGKLTIIGTRELRDSMPKIIKRVAKGERFLVLRHSTPLFIIEKPVDFKE